VLLHGDPQVDEAQRELHGMIRDLITEAVAAGSVRDDVPPDELAGYSIHALDAAGHAPSERSVARLVTLTLAAMHREH
jgi:cytochrome P450